MDIEVAALAGSAATVIVQAMATDAWQRVKSVVSKFFKRSPRYVDDLEKTRDHLGDDALSESQEVEALKRRLTTEVSNGLASLEDLQELHCELFTIIQTRGSTLQQLGAISNKGTVNQQGSGRQTNISNFLRD